MITDWNTKNFKISSFPQNNPQFHPTSCHWSVQFSSIAQSYPTLCDPWTAACQASLSITNSWSLFKLMCFGSVMPSNHLILYRPLFFPPQSFPASGSFQMSQFFTSDSPSIGVSALASVIPMNSQDWFPLGWTGWISLQSKGLSRVFSNTTAQKRQFLGTQSFPCLPPGDLPMHRWNARLLCPLHWWEDSFSLVSPGKLQLYINL